MSRKPSKPQLSPQVRARRLALQIRLAVLRGAGRGLNTARSFLTARIKERVSEPAPRKRIVNSAGEIYYRATTAAKAHAPPRKLSGRLRNSITSVMRDSTTAVIGANARGMPSKKHPLGFNYPKHHEIRDPAHPRSGQHKFMVPTVKEYRKELGKILGRSAKLEFR